MLAVTPSVRDAYIRFIRNVVTLLAGKNRTPITAAADAIVLLVELMGDF